MACEGTRRRRQTLKQRISEVETVVKKVETGIVSGRIKVKVGKQGAVAFDGLTEQERDEVSDACIYRRVMVSGSALARAAVARAEQMAGVGVNRQVIGSGVHSHDGGKTWERH